MKKAISLLKDILNLPGKTLQLDVTHEEGRRMYESFNKRHPRIPVFRNKSIGVALVDLHHFKSKEEYLLSVNGKNSAAYFSRKAAKAGYCIKKFNPAHYHQAIIEIHKSNPERQGGNLPSSYFEELSYPINEYNSYYGVFKDELLCGYIWAIESGDTVVFSRIMGHHDFLKEGIMYLLATAVIGSYIDEKPNIAYAMYDTYFGASEGLKMYKRRLGFTAFKVNWVKK